MTEAFGGAVGKAAGLVVQPRRRLAQAGLRLGRQHAQRGLLGDRVQGRPLRLGDELRRRHDLALPRRRGRQPRARGAGGRVDGRARRACATRRSPRTAASSTPLTRTRSVFGWRVGASGRTRPGRLVRGPARDRRRAGGQLMHVSRGFRGKRRDDGGRADRVPPGQYLTDGFPVLSAGPTPHTRLEDWTFSIVGEIDEPRKLDLGRAPGAAARGRHRRHPLRHPLVEAGHGLEGRLARHAARRRRDRGRLRRSRSATAATRRTCRSRTCSTARRGSRTATTASRSTPSTAAPRACSCRTSTSGRARSGCAGSSSANEDEPGFWETYGYHLYGDPWREQRYCGRLSWRFGEVVSVVDETPRCGRSCSTSRLAGAPAGPAPRRAPDGRRRLPRRAQLLDRETRPRASGSC